MRGALFAVMLILLLSSVSAEVLFNSQPKAVYNLGETIPVPLTIKATSEISGDFKVNLICDGQELNFHKSGVALSTG